ncbi:hypothetical protein Tco_0737174 [Tanacetum coccineum]
MIDYALWEVIKNGATFPKTTVVEGLKFNSIKDAKLLLEAVEKRFGGNAATKKTQMNLLKQQYENFTAPSSEMFDQTFDRLQKLVINAANFTNIDNLSDAIICSFFTSQPNSPQLVHDDLQQIHPDNIEEMDLRWQMAMLTMRARRFLKNTGRKLTVNGNGGNQDNKNKESLKRSVLVETSTSTTLVPCDDLGGYDWSDQVEEGPNYALMAYSSSSSDSELIESQIVDNCKKGLGYEKYNAVPPPYTGNFMPPTPDLSFTGLDVFVNKLVVENRKSDEEVSKVVRKFDDFPIIEDWVSDSEEENVSQTKTKNKTFKPSIAKIEFVKPKQQEKTGKKTVK